MSEENKETTKTENHIALPQRFIKPSEIGKYIQASGKLAELQGVIPKGTGVSGKSVIQGLMLAVMQNPQLIECSPATLISGAASSARFGLPLDPSLKMAYLVPRKSKVKRPGKADVYEWQACFQPSYRGLIALMNRAGVADYVETNVVYSKDFFEVKPGLPPVINHAPNFEVENRGEMIGVYAIAYKGGVVVGRKYLTKSEVLKRKAIAQTDKVWQAWPDEMWSKTAIHALCKTMPMSLELLYAVETENESLKTDFNEVDDSIIDAEFEVMKDGGSGAGALNKVLEGDKND